MFVVTEHNNETYLRHDLFDNLSATLVEPGKKVDSDGNVFYRIHENFRMIAASNPVDLRNQGRVRLSLAFRNRFREIWLNEITSKTELNQIAIDHMDASIPTNPGSRTHRLPRKGKRDYRR
jgi:hypothetical protein